MPAKPVPRERDEQMISLWNLGLSDGQIAFRIGVKAHVIAPRIRLLRAGPLGPTITRESSVGRPTTKWTKERTAEAHRLYITEGLSATQVAKQMGNGTTRCGVIGIAHREGWSRSPEFARINNARSGGRPASPNRALRAPAVPRVQNPLGAASKNRLRVLKEAAEPVVAFVPAPEALTPTATFADLRTGVCKWPIGDPQEAAFGFCGREANGTYCPVHHRAAYQPLTEEKKRSLNKLAAWVDGPQRRRDVAA